MKLIDVYDDTLPHAVLLWQLLSERQPEQSISHKSMPTATQHAAFIRSKPYLHWYVIDVEGLVGACYITKDQEIGIGILNEHKRKGYGKAAVQELMAKHPGKLLANINPANSPSLSLFSAMGFKHIQTTMEMT